MAGSINKVILVGNLGRDPEVRTTQSGERVATLSLATSESWTDRQTGERKERTEWHRVVIFNDRVTEVTERFLRKGSKASPARLLRYNARRPGRCSPAISTTRFRSEVWRGLLDPWIVSAFARGCRR